MSKLTVSSFKTSPGVQNWKGPVVYLQLFYTGGVNGQSFSFSTGEVWSPSYDDFYREIECQLDGNVITVPTFELDTTTDIIGQPGVYLSMRIQQASHRRSNEPDIRLADRWQVPAVLQGLTVVTFEMLRQFNNPVRNYIQDTSQVARSQVAQMISDAVNVGNPATTTAIGRLKTSITPPDPASPTAYVVGDPNVVLTADSRIDLITPKLCGALGDGTGATITTADVAAHATGTRYPWRGSYTVGVDTKDYVGLQEAVYQAFGGPLDDGTDTGIHKTAKAYLNKPLFISNGKYVINKAVQLKGLVGWHIYGAGRFATWVVQTTANTSCFNFDGVAYGKLEGIEFSSTQSSNVALVEMDWTGAITTLKPQQMTIADIEFAGSNQVAYGFRLAKSGGGAQGDTINFDNCKWESFTTAGYATGTGAFNAMNVQFHGGNILGCPLYGIYVSGGNVHVYSMNFENNIGAGQDPNGYDIYITGNANHGATVIGCRSESLRYLYTDAGLQVLYLGNHAAVGGTNAPAQWSPGATWTVGQRVYSTTVGKSDGRMWKATAVAGASGGTEPTWTGSSVTDGGVTWAPEEYDAVVVSGGTLESNIWSFGRLAIGDATNKAPIAIRDNTFSRTDWLKDSSKTPSLVGLVVTNNFVRLGYAGPNTSAQVVPYSLSNVASGPGTTHASASNISALFNNTPLVWLGGNGGGIYYGDVGFTRGAGSHTAVAGNTVQAIGGLTLASFTFAQVNAAAPTNGTLVYVSDGTPGSNPLTGGGTGCLAIRQNGAWKGL